ncbi:MAG: hypothetical protein ACLTBF_02415 [Christensenellales bacterium]
MAQKAQTEYGGICDAFMARVDAFLHTNDAAGYRAALALRRAGNENESDGTLWIFPPLPWTNHALDSAARVR